jgi:hypothetical protein
MMNFLMMNDEWHVFFEFRFTIQAKLKNITIHFNDKFYN